MHPIAYCISVRQSHPAYPVLAELEGRFGSYFEEFTVQELHALLTVCAFKSDRNCTWSLHENRNICMKVRHALKLINHLEANIQLGLVRFLADVISTRGENN